MTVIIYTDGACKGNGKSGNNAGGYGTHIQYPNGDVLNIWGGHPDTTNNRMELMATITALERLSPSLPLQIHTDSTYVKDGITKWLQTWRNNNWRKTDGKPVLNLDLWQHLDQLVQNRQIHWHWVKGHAGHAGNETADTLANLGVYEHGEEYIYYNATQTPTDISLITDQYTDDGYYNHLQSLEWQTDNIHADMIDTSSEAAPKKRSKKSTKASQSPMTVHRHSHQNPEYDGDTSDVNPNFWAVLPDPINKDKAERQLIMDTETTGFEDQKGDRIVEIGIIELVGRKFTGQQLHVYLNPDKIMDEEVIKVHGISNAFLLDKPRFSDVAQYVYDFMKGAEIIAHNANFDMRFLKMEFDKVGLTDFYDQVHVTDSLALARQLYPGQKNSLDALVRRLGVGQKDRTFHGALLDSEILAEVYLAMTGGQIALAIEEEKNDTGNDEEFGFVNLSQFASTLVVSNSDLDADSQWRATILK